MQTLALGLLWITALVAAQGQQTFIGTVTDTECANANHSQMQMGSTDAECTTACIFAHGAMYVLHDSNEVHRFESSTRFFFQSGINSSKARVSKTFPLKI